VIDGSQLAAYSTFPEGEESGPGGGGEEEK
jgi:hypothetical protein